jgi:hypothetical protein
VTRLALAAAAVVLAACSTMQPVGWMHGGRLTGEVITAPVEDWSFTRDLKKIQVETNPASPYSVNVWCVAKGPNLWVTAGSRSSDWAQNALADPRVRVRVAGKIYERLAVPVRDPAEVELVLRLYEEKYDFERSPNGVFGPTQFRLDPR